MQAKNDQFRPVNQQIGDKPAVGPIASEQLIPWALLGALACIISSLFQFSTVQTIFVVAWLIASWWLLTGKTPWKFLSKFIRTPSWSQGYVAYTPLLPKE